jgi:hypothetical protein
MRNVMRRVLGAKPRTRSMAHALVEVPKFFVDGS